MNVTSLLMQIVVKTRYAVVGEADEKLNPLCGEA